MEPSSCECVLPIPVLIAAQHHYSHIGRVHHAAKSTADFGAVAFSPFRTPFVGGQYTSTVLAHRPSGEFPLVRRRVRGLPKPIFIYSRREEQTHSSMLSKSSMVYMAICFPSSFPHHRHHLFLFQWHLYDCRQYRNLCSAPLIHPLRGQNRVQSLGPHPG